MKYIPNLIHPVKIKYDGEHVNFTGSNNIGFQLRTEDFDLFLDKLQSDCLPPVYNISEVWQAVVKPDLFMFMIKNSNGKYVPFMKLEGFQARYFFNQLTNMKSNIQRVESYA